MYDAPIRAEVISLAFYRWTSANGLCKMQSGARGRAPLLDGTAAVAACKPGRSGISSRRFSHKATQAVKGSLCL